MDVLKEMSDCVQLLYDEGNIHSASGLDDARDAVSELIEAAYEVLYELRDKSEAKAALIAALKKARGK